jgi:hypothetical protein
MRTSLRELAFLRSSQNGRQMLLIVRLMLAGALRGILRIGAILAFVVLINAPEQ